MTVRDFLEKNGYRLTVLSRMVEMCSECDGLLERDKELEVEKLFELLMVEAAKP